MSERESFEQILPLELRATDVKIWRGKAMQHFNLTGCDRIRINPNTIEFDCGSETYVIPLEGNDFAVSCPYTHSVQYDQRVKNFQPKNYLSKNYLSIETCSN